MKKLKFLIPVCLIAFTAIVTGCKKEQAEIDKESKEGSVINDVDKKNGYEIVKLQNGWQTFNSSECGFEISYPEDFHSYSHCDEKNLIGISNIMNDPRNPYMKDGDMSIVLSKMGSEVDDLEKWIENNFKEGKSDKLGNIKINKKQVTFMDNKGFDVELEYDAPIEGLPGLFKYLFFNVNNTNYQIQANIPVGNTEMKKEFERIVNSISFAKK